MVEPSFGSSGLTKIWIVLSTDYELFWNKKKTRPEPNKRPLKHQLHALTNRAVVDPEKKWFNRQYKPFCDAMAFCSLSRSKRIKSERLPLWGSGAKRMKKKMFSDCFRLKLVMLPSINVSNTWLPKQEKVISGRKLVVDFFRWRWHDEVNILNDDDFIHFVTSGWRIWRLSALTPLIEGVLMIRISMNSYYKRLESSTSQIFSNFSLLLYCTENFQ